MYFRQKTWMEKVSGEAQEKEAASMMTVSTPPSKKIEAKEDEAENRSWNSLNGSGVIGKPERDSSDGFVWVEDCSLPRQLDN